MTDRTDSSIRTPSLDAIARPGGGFAMVAMDQRESLRAMFDLAGAGRPADDVLTAFKLDVARELAPAASGFLIDRQYGFDAVRDAGSVPPTTGLILAVDALTQEDGGPVEETALDLDVLSDERGLASVAGIKLLIIWRRDARREDRVALAHEFTATARRLGVLSVLEPVVRATPEELQDGSWDRDEAILEAAAELSTVGQSLYKAQVPLAGEGTPDEQRRASAALDAATTGPWVVLSQGVRHERFLPAVEAACREGASGFLAGRALWSDVVGDDDVATRLRDVARPRLDALVEVVDRHARPWRDA